MLKHSFVLGTVAVLVGIIPSCGGDDDGAPPKLAEPCHANSDCGGDLVCALGKCHEQCANSKDCPAGQRCVKTDTSTACQLPAESKCTFNSNCESPLVCGIDRSCRNQCQADRDCLSGQFCDVSLTCADRTEVPDGGGLPDLGGPKPDAGGGADGAGGTAGAGGAAGSGGTGGGDGAAGAGGAAGTGGAGGSMPDAGTADASLDVSMDSTPDRTTMDISTNPDSLSPDAGCGHRGEACCATGTICELGSTCDTNNVCIACGQKDQACCSGATACLAANLDCVSGTCQCGGQGQVCCGGTMCSSGFTCSGGGDAGKPTCGCGGNAQACCANSMCANGTLSCAGTKCTCATSCFSARSSNDTHVLRSDGTAWYYTGYSVMPVVVSDASSVPVTGFTKIATGDTFSCGIKSDKTAWCWWNTAPGGTMATYGQLGDGTTNASKSPVQVLKADATPITNITDIATHTNFTCAVTGDHAVYCWGANSYGQLGIGLTSTYSAFATPVVTSMGGTTPFSGPDQVSLGATHACAHNIDNTVFCWGYNYYGQLGTGDTTNSSFPVQVTALSNQASQVALANQFSCARTGDSAWCWGNNSYGLGDGMTTSSKTPVRVQSAGMTDFNGVSDLRAAYYGACALKSADKSVWCWGSFQTSSMTPIQATPAGFPLTQVYYWDIMASSMCFATTNAELYIANGKATYPVACP